MAGFSIFHVRFPGVYANNWINTVPFYQREGWDLGERKTWEVIWEPSFAPVVLITPNKMVEFEIGYEKKLPEG